MSLLSIVEAAKQFNVTRSRIYRAIENGHITPHIENGVKLVDASDMVRTFSNQRTKTNTKKPVQTISTIQNEQQIKLLEQQLEFAREKAEFYKHQVNEIRKDYEDFKKAIGFNNPPTPLQPEQEQNKENDAVQTQSEFERNDIGRTDQNTQKSDQRVAPKKHGLFGRMIRTLIDD